MRRKEQRSIQPFSASLHDSDLVLGGESQSDDSVDLASLLSMALKRWKLIATVFTMVLALAVVYCILKTPEYMGDAKLSIGQDSSDPLASLEDIGIQGGPDLDTKLQTDQTILTSDALAWQVIEELRLDQKPGFAGKKLRSEGKCGIIFCPLRSGPNEPFSSIDVQHREKMLQLFQKKVKVAVVPKTMVMEIQFLSSDAKLAAEVPNRLGSDFITRSFKTRYQTTMEASGWLSQQLDELKRNVEAAQKNLNAYQKERGIIGSDENNNITLSKLDDLSKELTQAEADRITKEARYRLAQTGNPELIGTLVPDTVLPVLRTQQAQLETQLADAKTRYGSAYPKVVQLSSQLNQVKTNLDREMSDILSRFKNEYQAAVKTEGDVRGAFNRQEQEAYSKGESYSEYAILKREVDSGRDLYEDLQRKMKEAGVQASLKVTNVDVIDPAVITFKPAKPNLPVVLSLGMLGGIFLGLLAAYVSESLDHTVLTPEDVESITVLPNLAEIPKIPTEKMENTLARSPVVLQLPESGFAESFRALRTSLMLSTAGGPPKLIMVTSSLPGEGKSTVACNLATTLAMSGTRVVLVDADLRRGKLANQFSIELNAGLSGCLTSMAKWRDVVQTPLEMANLQVLCCGHRPPNPSELLASPKMLEILNELRSEYDFLVVDTPPGLAVTDPILVSPYADAMLLVARCGQTHRHALRRMSERLSRAKAKVAGVVFNAFDPNTSYYEYGSYYGSYDSYYTSDVSNGNGSGSGIRKKLKAKTKAAD